MQKTTWYELILKLCTISVAAAAATVVRTSPGTSEAEYGNRTGFA